MSNLELIALIIEGNGIRADRAIAVASRVILETGSISRLSSLRDVDFARITGVSPKKALQLAAVAELSRRMLVCSEIEKAVCSQPAVVAELMRPITIGLEVEKFWVLCLSRKNRLIKLSEVSSGTATATLAHPREVFRTAIRYAAVSIICVHNHPSGDPAPSASDLQLTRILREAAKTVDIQLLDHVIIGRAEHDALRVGFFSFREAGLA